MLSLTKNEILHIFKEIENDPELLKAFNKLMKQCEKTGSVCNYSKVEKKPIEWPIILGQHHD